MKKLTLTAEIERLDEVLDFVNEELEAHDAPMKTMMQIAIAVEEIFCNIAHHAYGESGGEAEIAIAVLEEPRRACIRFADRGIPYDPLSRQDPDITLGVEERDIGGLGVYMVKKSMDEMSYAYEDGQNILTMCKRL